MTFVLGAAVGAAVTALLTPTTGEELRERIKLILQRKVSSQLKMLTNW